MKSHSISTILGKQTSGWICNKTASELPIYPVLNAICLLKFHKITMDHKTVSFTGIIKRHNFSQHVHIIHHLHKIVSASTKTKNRREQSYKLTCVNHRDVRNRFFNFGSLSVQFLKKTRNRFGMNLVWFGLQKLDSVRMVIYYWCRLIVEQTQIYSKYNTNKLCWMNCAYQTLIL